LSGSSELRYLLDYLLALKVIKNATSHLFLTLPKLYQTPHRNPATAMRLLRYSDTGDLNLIQFGDEAIPPYAILSHTWGAETEEVTFKDLIDGTGKDKPGYKKIRFCREQASRDGIEYFWIDTCCIDKEDRTELSLATVSMFQWYRNANQCYVYPSGLSTIERTISGRFTCEPAFSESQWPTRGWTFQEFLAPHSVEIFTPRVQEVERLKAKFMPEYLMECLIPRVSVRGVFIELQNASRLSEDISVLGLDTMPQTVKKLWDSHSEAICGQGRRWTYEQSIKNGQYARKLRHEERQELVYCEMMALGRDVTECEEIGANCGLCYRYIWNDALCTIQDEGADSAKQSKLTAQYSRNAFCSLDRSSLDIEKSCLVNNLWCLVMHIICGHRLAKSLITNLENSGSDAFSVGVQDPSRITVEGSSAINVQNSSKIHQQHTYPAPQYAYQALQLPLPHEIHIAPTWGGIDYIPFVPGTEEQFVVDSNVTCSTALSDKTSVFSKSSEDDPAAGTEISNHYNPSANTSQSWQEVPLLRVGQILPASAHESCEPKLWNNGLMIRGFEDSHLIADGREDSGYGDQELPLLGKDTAHSEEAILANYETSALRDFVDDPGHQYWTWCKEHQNWWHKDKKTNAMIWAPLDFD
jgi:hypothetical protein